MGGLQVALKRRIESYNEQTVPVVDHYGATEGVVVDAVSDNRRPPAAVLDFVKAELEGY